MTEKREAPDTRHIPPPMSEIPPPPPAPGDAARSWPVLARPPRRCPSVVPGVFGHPDERCVLMQGHTDPPWHTVDPTRDDALRWNDSAAMRVDETADTFVPHVMEVRPGDALIMVIPEDYGVDEDVVRGWVDHLREELPEGVTVTFMVGVQPIVVRGGQS